MDLITADATPEFHATISISGVVNTAREINREKSIRFLNLNIGHALCAA